VSSTQIKLGQEARDELLKWLGIISSAVGSTMGPGGCPFGFDKLGTDGRLTPSFSKDGLTVLRSLDFSVPAAQAVLTYARQASSMSVIASGDGTSSTVVLAYQVAKSIMESGEKFPQQFARQIETEAHQAIELIRKEAIKNDDVVRQVALTSTNGDQELTDVVLQSINQSSALGTIIVDKNPASKERYKITRQDGYSNCQGYQYHQAFALSASEKAASNKTINWHSPAVMVFNGTLAVKEQTKPILSAWAKLVKDTGQYKKLVIFAYDIYDEIANELMVLNRRMLKDDMAVFVVKPKLIAEPNGSINIMMDLAAYCGITDEFIVDGGNYMNANNNHFGTCDQINIGAFGSAVLGRAKTHWVEKRLLQNQSLLEECRDEFTKQIVAIRNAELAEGLVKVEVGGGQLPDLQERADRFDDASKAAQSCMVHGALPGCGVSYIRAGMLAIAHPALLEAFRAVYGNVLYNFGLESDTAYLPAKGETVKIYKDETGSGVKIGQATELGVFDATETICAVIKNGVDLGIRIATMGGFSFRDLKSTPEYGA
jgi:chaperonin GroEL